MPRQRSKELSIPEQFAAKQHIYFGVNFGYCCWLLRLVRAPKLFISKANDIDSNLMKFSEKLGSIEEHAAATNLPVQVHSEIVPLQNPSAWVS